MTPQMLGLLAGAALALIKFGIVRQVAARRESGMPPPEQRRSAGMRRVVGYADLIVFPLLGYYVVPMVMK